MLEVGTASPTERGAGIQVSTTSLTIEARKRTPRPHRSSDPRSRERQPTRRRGSRCQLVLGRNRGATTCCRVAHHADLRRRCSCINGTPQHLPRHANRNRVVITGYRAWAAVACGLAGESRDYERQYRAGRRRRVVCGCAGGSDGRSAGVRKSYRRRAGLPQTSCVLAGSRERKGPGGLGRSLRGRFDETHPVHSMRAPG